MYNFAQSNESVGRPSQSPTPKTHTCPRSFRATIATVRVLLVSGGANVRRNVIQSLYILRELLVRLDLQRRTDIRHNSTREISAAQVETTVISNATNAVRAAHSRTPASSRASAGTGAGKPPPQPRAWRHAPFHALPSNLFFPRGQAVHMASCSLAHKTPKRTFQNIFFAG